MNTYRYFATAPTGGVELLADELRAAGAQALRLHPRGVHFEGPLEAGCRALLWSRVANRIYLQLLDVAVETPDEIHQAVRSLDWSGHMTADTPFSVSFTGQGAGVRHTHYGALRIKDAVADYWRERVGYRPPVQTDGRRLALHAHVEKGRLQLYLDLSGFGLHQRGYRAGVAFDAPLKENVAAAVLLRCGWPTTHAEGGALVDPMCGSGTFLVEAAWMALDRAPQLDNAARMSLLCWRGHDPALWQRLVAEAFERQEAGWQHPLRIEGRDVSPRSLKAARQVLRQAGLTRRVTLHQTALADQTGVEGTTGLVVTNPPYGERLGRAQDLRGLYARLGTLLKTHFVGWQAGVFTCREELVTEIGLRPEKQHPFRNGALDCRLVRYRVEPEHFREPPIRMEADVAVQVAARLAEWKARPGAQMFANRLRKNLRRLKGWLKREGVSAFRAYDADIPEYALAVDVYDTLDASRWVVVYEYAPPKSVDGRKARAHLLEAMAVLPEVLDVSPGQVVYKVRQRQKGRAQYRPLDMKRDFHQVMENGARLWVNFHDYLDTGLFLDHRYVRRTVAEASRGRRLLNLFCYTASATVEAAVAGAAESLSVDLSRTYLEWARRNLELNGQDARIHRLERADVLRWLSRPPRGVGRFEVIFLDPPSFSTSKRMEGTLDIQRDHVQLIEQAGHLLDNGGVLFFSTNLRRFRLDPVVVQAWKVTDLTAATLPPDFARNRRIHQVWRLEKRE